MRFKHFNIAIFSRIGMIVILSGLTVFLILKNYDVWANISFVLLILVGYNLIHYFNGINRWIAFFLLGIKNEDTSLKIPQNTGNKTIDQVFEGMQNLNNLFKQTKIEIATQEQYFKTIINKSATGLFAINENGRIENINPAAQKLLDVQEYQHLNALNKVDNQLVKFIEKVDKPDQSAIFENKYGQKLLFNVSYLQNKNERIKLIAVSDITKELDNREIEAWIKLARTLSHEIMNNITPITTLSQVISGYFTQNGTIIKTADEKIIKNTVKGLDIIEGRSVALMNFVNNYRKFTKLPEPDIKTVNLSKIIEKSLIVLRTYPAINRIKIEKNIPSNIKVFTDEQLLSQVIINLLKNAYESLLESSNIPNPALKISLTENDKNIYIHIINNGNPIPDELKEQIFVPFFTTKETGSGVGLSLSKQILLKMGGDVVLKQSDERFTEFRVILKK